MTGRTALLALIGAVKVGRAKWHEIEKKVLELWPEWPEIATRMSEAYGLGSLDAARALHVILVPYWIWAVSTTSAIVTRKHVSEMTFSHSGCHAARAWVIAILLALLSELWSRAEATPYMNRAVPTGSTLPASTEM